MEVFSKAQTKIGKGPAGSENLTQTIKKAKYDRARKAVNNSFDRSIGSLRRRKQKKVAALNQSFVLKQAATLQRKNKEIIMALARAKQYSSQLEKINYYFKQQQMTLVMRVASYVRKLKTLSDDYQSLKKHSDFKDKLLSSLRQQLTSSLDAIDRVQGSDNQSLPVTTDLVPLHPMRIVRDASSKRHSEVSSCSETVEVENVKKAEVANTLDRVLQSPAMPMLMEEPSHEQEKSYLDITTDVLNVGSANLDVSNCGELSDSNCSESECETGSEHSESGNSDINDDDDIAENLTNHDTVSMELTDVVVNEETQQDNVDEDTVEKNDGISDQTLENVSLKSTKSPEKMMIVQKRIQANQARSKTKHPEGKMTKKKPCAESTNKSSFHTVSMELADVIVSEETQQDNVDEDTVEKNTGISDQTLENVSLRTAKSPETTMLVQKRSQARSKIKDPEGKMSKKKPCAESTNNVDEDTVEKNAGISGQTLENVSLRTAKSLETTMLVQKRIQARSKIKHPEGKMSKKKVCVDFTNKSSYDFLSCSSDSFVQDTEKRVKLTGTSAKSLSPKKALLMKNTTKERLSQPATTSNDENLVPTRRTVRRRAAGAVSYAEPSLHAKLRRGDQIADASLFQSITPKKKSGKKKILKRKVQTESQITE